MTEPYASQRELDDMKQDIREMRQTISVMDASGTRGVVGLQTSLTDLVKDVTEMKTQFTGWISSHEEQHRQDNRDRINGRRWLIGTGVAGVASMTAVIALLADLLRHTH